MVKSMLREAKFIFFAVAPVEKNNRFHICKELGKHLGEKRRSIPSLVILKDEYR